MFGVKQVLIVGMVKRVDFRVSFRFEPKPEASKQMLCIALTVKAVEYTNCKFMGWEGLGQVVGLHSSIAAESTATEMFERESNKVHIGLADEVFVRDRGCRRKPGISSRETVGLVRSRGNTRMVSTVYRYR